MSPAPATLLFASLVSSTELTALGGDEEAQRTFRGQRRLLERCVTAHGGEEMKWLGEGLMAAFASPGAAARCAISMQQSARRQAAGAICVGLSVAAVKPDESDDLGASAALAHRLCETAQPGQILCSAKVFGLFSGHPTVTFRDRGPLALEGLAVPVAAYELTYPPVDPSVAVLTQTPFVGRADELARLTTQLDDVRAGNGGVVLVAGEPGIGKTRTIGELAESALSDGVLVLRGRCYEGEAARPYGPFVEALADFARTAPLDELRAGLGLGAGPLARLVPVLRERLPDIPEPVSLRPSEERVRLLDAVVQFLMAVSARAPVLLVLDDLHWADAATVALLRHVARFAGRQRLLLLGAYRDAEIGAQHPLTDALGALPREASYQHLALAGLDADEVAELLDAVGDQKAPRALVAALTAETSGNPFFIREVLLHLVEEGKIFQREGRWTSDLTIEEMGIPRSVRPVIRRRLARLSEPANRLLRAAAVFSGGVRFTLVARVAGLGEAEALDATDEAVAAQLLRSTGDADSLDFTHALVRHTLLAELSAPRRLRLHRQIAELMEEVLRDAAADHAGEIAHHYYRSAALPGAARGATWAILAADQAERNAAFGEVVRLLQIALALLPEDDGRRPRALGRLALALAWTLSLEAAVQTAGEAGELIARSESDAEAAHFLADVADAMWLMGQTPHAWAAATQGLRHARDRRSTAWARLMVYDLERREAADPEFPGIAIDSVERREMIPLLGKLTALQHPAQQLSGYLAFQSREEALTLAGDQPLALVFWAGEYRRALPLLEGAAATALQRGQIGVAALHRSLTARVYAALGDLPASMSEYAVARELTERAGETPWLRLMMSLVVLYQVNATGEGWDLVLASIEQTLREAASENQGLSASTRGVAAYAAAHLGRADEALRWLESTLPAIERAPGSALGYVPLIGTVASALEAIGRTDHVETIERNLRAKCLQPDFRHVGNDMRVSLAQLRGLQGAVDEAKEWFAKGRAVLEEQGARPQRARVDLYEARLHLRRGSAEDARLAASLLDAALTQFRAIGMPGWIRVAEELRLRCGAELPDRRALPERVIDPERRPPPPIETRAATAAAPVAARFHCEGDYWVVEYSDGASRIKNLKGLHYVAELLRHPGRELHVMDLVQGGRSEGVQLSSGGLEALDAAAKASYKRRLSELREELEEAERCHDIGRAERMQEEIDAITGQLAAAFGLGGRSRISGSATERARTAVAKRISEALKQLAAANPLLADHLRSRIRTGTFCVYVPDATRPVEWEV